MPLPVRRTADVGKLAILLALSLGVDRFFSVPFFVDLFFAGAILIVAENALTRIIQLSRPDEPDHDSGLPVGVHDARRAYLDDEIDEQELDRRIGRALDPDVRAIRDRYESINGVGPKTCFRLADHFGTVESIDQADADELESIDGIGPKTAADIVDHDVATE